MVSANSGETTRPIPIATYRGAPVAATATRIKIVVVGGFGVGKTTFVEAGSQITGLYTEAPMTQAGAGIDDPTATPDKTDTTVAMDFGRTVLDGDGEPIMLFLFGVPGQERFRFMWDTLITGALGGIVLLDTRRIEDCFRALGHLEQHHVPYLVAINAFPGAPRYPDEEIRDALQLPPAVPLLDCDARRRPDAHHVLTALVEYLISISDTDTDAEESL